MDNAPSNNEASSGTSALDDGLGVLTTKRAITPAMREWLRRLSNPRACEWVKNTPTQMHVHGRGAGSLGSPTYIMAERMLDAGLLRYEPRDAAGGYTEYVAELTEFGRAQMTPNVELTGAARLYRAASSDRRERG